MSTSGEDRTIPGAARRGSREGPPPGRPAALVRAGVLGALAVAAWLAVCACGGSNGGGDGNGACPSGQTQSCLSAASDTCLCGVSCSSQSECSAPEGCYGDVCVALETYCQALFADDPTNPFAPCQPYQPAGGSCTTASLANNCTTPGNLVCNTSFCCPESTPYFCPGQCYGTAAEAAAACTGCITCTQ